MEESTSVAEHVHLRTVNVQNDPKVSHTSFCKRSNRPSVCLMDGMKLSRAGAGIIVSVFYEFNCKTFAADLVAVKKNLTPYRTLRQKQQRIWILST